MAQAINEAELAALSAANVVTGWAIGIDTGGVGAMLKLRCGERDHLYFVRKELALSLSVGIRRAVRKRRWVIGDSGDTPTINDVDWGIAHRSIVAHSRAVEFSDAMVWAISTEVETSLHRVFRLPSALAAGLAALLWNEFRTGDHRSPGDQVH